jgi:hypothetical protein
MPAKAGIQRFLWTPAFAGVTSEERLLGVAVVRNAAPV